MKNKIIYVPHTINSARNLSRAVASTVSDAIKYINKLDGAFLVALSKHYNEKWEVDQGFEKAIAKRCALIKISQEHIYSILINMKTYKRRGYLVDLLDSKHLVKVAKYYNNKKGRKVFESFEMNIGIRCDELYEEEKISSPEVLKIIKNLRCYQMFTSLICYLEEPELKDFVKYAKKHLKIDDNIDYAIRERSTKLFELDRLYDKKLLRLVYMN